MGRAPDTHHNSADRIIRETMIYHRKHVAFVTGPTVPQTVALVCARINATGRLDIADVIHATPIVRGARHDERRRPSVAIGLPRQKRLRRSE
jgi:hypothetical protein